MAQSNLELFAPNSRKAMIAALMQRAGQPNPSLGGSIGHALALGLMGLYEGQDEKAALKAVEMQNDVLRGSSPMGNVDIPNAAAEAPTVKPTGKGFAFPDRAYSADEFNPLDAQVAKPSELAAALSDKMTPKDLDVAARTVIGEAGGYNPIDKQNVAAVLLNRSNLAGTSPATEALKPNQFEPWNTAAGRARMNVPQDSPAYQDAARAVYMATQADPTGGATHFYSPNAQASLGRQPPKWDDGSGTDIGPHRFFSQPYAGQQATAFAPQPSAPDVPPAITQGPPVQVAQNGAPTNPLIDRYEQMARDPNSPLNPQQRSAILSSANQMRMKAIDEARAFQMKAKEKLLPSYGDVDPTQQGYKYGDQAQKLRKEVGDLPSYKNLAQAAPIYKTMFETAGRDTRASDLNLVYGLGKIFDPNSVVREGEMVMVSKTASLPDWLVGTINSINGGARLTPETRAAILQEAHSRITQYQSVFENDAKMYRGIAQRGRINEADVIPDFGTFEPWKAPNTNPSLANPPTNGVIDLGDGVTLRPKRK